MTPKDGEPQLSLDSAMKLLSVMGKSGLEAWWSNAPAECKTPAFVAKMMELHEVFGDAEFQRMIEGKMDEFLSVGYGGNRVGAAEGPISAARGEFSDGFSVDDDVVVIESVRPKVIKAEESFGMDFGCSQKNQPKFCWRCGSEDHLSRNCLESRKRGNGLKCGSCKQPGHYTRNCPKPISCRKCGKQGHIAKDCGKRAQQMGGLATLWNMGNNDAGPNFGDGGANFGAVGGDFFDFGGAAGDYESADDDWE